MLYWKLSFYELSTKVRLKLGEMNAQALCQFSAFAIVAQQALGGGEKPKPKYDLATGAGTAESAVAQINAAMAGGG